MPELKVLSGSRTLRRSFPGGTRLYDALLAMGFDAGGACGGHGTCGKCLVEMSGKPRKVSACHSILDEDVTIVLPPPVTDESSPGPRPALTSGSFGIAMDLGTTSLVFYLYSLNEKRALAVRSLPNPQRAYGADVITRIDRCRGGYLEAQRDVVRQALNEMIDAWKRDFGLASIARVVVAGNPTMGHLFWGVSPLLFQRTKNCCFS